MVLEPPAIREQIELDFNDGYEKAKIHASYVKCIAANSAEVMGFLFFNPDHNWFCEVGMVDV